MRGHLHLEKHQHSSFQYNIPITKTQVKTIFKNEVIFPPGGALVAWNKQKLEAGLRASGCFHWKYVKNFCAWGALVISFTPIKSCDMIVLYHIQ